MSFNIAVRSWFFNDSHATEKVDILPSMIKVTMPTAERQSNPDNDLSPEMLALASRDISLACASRFFEEVHPMYWLFPSEDFYTRFEATYSSAHVPLASSWLCTLHSIVALGASCEARTSIDTLREPSITTSSINLQTFQYLLSKFWPGTQRRVLAFECIDST